MMIPTYLPACLPTGLIETSAQEELKKYGPLDDIDVYEEDEDGETTIQVGIVFAES